MAPLKVALGTEPRNPLSLPLDQPLSDQAQGESARKAQEMVEQTKAVQDLAKQNARQAQATMEEQANRRRREVDFTVGDAVYIHKRGFTTESPTTRLDSQYAGPWRILEERGHSFVLDVPPWFKGKNLFHADRLRKAAEDPLPQQVRLPEPPEEINGEPEWEVERILASRLRNNKLEYQVSWRGCDPDETWYPARNFKNSATLLEVFHQMYPDAAGPPVHLQQWIRKAAGDEYSTDLDDDDEAEHGSKGARVRKRHATRHS